MVFRSCPWNAHASQFLVLGNAGIVDVANCDSDSNTDCCCVAVASELLAGDTPGVWQNNRVPSIVLYCKATHIWWVFALCKEDANFPLSYFFYTIAETVEWEMKNPPCWNDHCEQKEHYARDNIPWIDLFAK